MATDIKIANMDYILNQDGTAGIGSFNDYIDHITKESIGSVIDDKFMGSNTIRVIHNKNNYFCAILNLQGFKCSKV
jgi:hypothetical protein